jgi:ApaG protein
MSDFGVGPSLDRLPLLPLQELLLMLSVHDVVAVSRACKRLNRVIDADVETWRHRCAADFLESGSSRERYIELFGAYGRFIAFYARMRKAVDAIFSVSFAAVPTDEIRVANRNLLRAAKRVEAWRVAPLQVQALWLLAPSDEFVERAGQPALGGYSFYHQVVCHTPFSVAHVPMMRARLTSMIAQSIVVSNDTGHVWSLLQVDPTDPVVPAVKIHDSVLDLLETMAASVAAGDLQMENLDDFSQLSLFPRRGPHVRVAETAGIRVTCSPVPVLAASTYPEILHVYDITIEGMSNCERMRLRSRHWRIVDVSGREERVDGPGVIGLFPIVEPGSRFSYRSCCSMRTERSPGTMGGYFTFARLRPGENEPAPGADADLLHVVVPTFDLRSINVTRRLRL